MATWMGYGSQVDVWTTQQLRMAQVCETEWGDPKPRWRNDADGDGADRDAGREPAPGCVTRKTTLDGQGDAGDEVASVSVALSDDELRLVGQASGVFAFRPRTGRRAGRERERRWIGATGQDGQKAALLCLKR